MKARAMTASGQNRPSAIVINGVWKVNGSDTTTVRAS